MGHVVVRQPNGKYALYSTVVDHFLWYDATEKEARDLLLESLMLQIWGEIDDAMRAADEDWKPYIRQPGNGLDRWDHAIRTALMYHGDDEKLKLVLRAAGLDDNAIAQLRAEVEANLPNDDD